MLFFVNVCLHVKWTAKEESALFSLVIEERVCKLFFFNFRFFAWPMTHFDNIFISVLAWIEVKTAAIWRLPRNLYNSHFGGWKVVVDSSSWRSLLIIYSYTHDTSYSLLNTCYRGMLLDLDLIRAFLAGTFGGCYCFRRREKVFRRLFMNFGLNNNRFGFIMLWRLTRQPGGGADEKSSYSKNRTN